MTADDGLALARPRSLRHRELSALATLDYAKNPLVVEQGSAGGAHGTALVAHELTLQSRVAVGLYDRLTLMGGLDVVLAMSGQRFSDPVAQQTSAPADGPGLGDGRLGLRYVPFGDASRTYSLAVQGQLTLPLAEAASSAQNLSGERSVSFRPDVLAELKPGRYRVNASLGALVRRNGQLLGTTLGDLACFGLGGAVQLPGKAELLSVLAELHGSTALRHPFARATTPLELLLGARASLRDHWLVSAAAGPGLSHGIGTPDFRVLATLAFKAGPLR